MGAGASAGGNIGLNPEEVASVLAAVKDLQFEDAERARGRSLLMLKDQLFAYASILNAIHSKFGIGVEALAGFITSCKTMEVGGGEDDDLDTDAVTNVFFEACGYPEDEDDEAQRKAIKMSVPQFGAALTRLANQRVLMEQGEATIGLAEQLRGMMEEQVPKLKLEACDEVAVKAAVPAEREDSEFQAPADFRGKHLCELQFAIGDQDALRVLIEVDADAAPNAAYNFACLCSGEKGLGLLSAVPLHYRGSRVHRVCSGMFVQGGDIQFGNGTGGDSVYGGMFRNEDGGLAKVGGFTASQALFG
jgi:hypothetical protein